MLVIGSMLWLFGCFLLKRLRFPLDLLDPLGFGLWFFLKQELDSVIGQPFFKVTDQLHLIDLFELFISIEDLDKHFGDHRDILVEEL